MKTLFLSCVAVMVIVLGSNAGRPNTIPAVQVWYDSSGVYTFSKRTAIVINSADFSTLCSAAVTLAEDIFLLSSEKSAPCTLLVKGATSGNSGDIFLKIDSSDASLNAEGYRLEISEGITIKAKTTYGIFNGTRTILQLLKQGYVFNRGSARDWPVFKERGLMVDFGRKWFPASWIYKHIRDLSYIKKNIFHLHLSDNLGFRLPSKKHPEITSPAFYTLAQIDSINKLAEKYHITIIPEIDMPGHLDYALKKHPEIAISSTARPYISLHLGKDSAWTFARELLEEFIPLFPGPYWHVGADEYPEDVYSKDTLFRHYAKKHFGVNAIPQDCYYGFVNWANKIVRSHGKIMRAWKDGMVSTAAVKIDTNIIVEHWYKGYGPPAQTMLNRGHSLINCHYTRLYYTLGGPKLNAQDLYDNWEPYMLEADDPISDKHHPGLRGAKVHVWCDDSGSQSVVTIENNILNGLRAVAQKTWEAPKLVANYSAFTPIINTIGRAPGFKNSNPKIPHIEVQAPTGMYSSKPVKSARWYTQTESSSVQIHSCGAHSLSLFTLQGKRVFHLSGLNYQTYDLSEITANGIYIMRIKTDLESVVRTIYVRN